MAQARPRNKNEQAKGPAWRRGAPGANANESLAKLVRGRLPWLVGGLLGASLAAGVVGSFEEELERAATLASFIPVVTATAIYLGNAGVT